MNATPSDIGELLRRTRRQLKLTQKDLALTSGTGLRFIIDLEKGKPTCEIGKALMVLQTLGIGVTLTSPALDMPGEPQLSRSDQGPAEVILLDRETTPSVETGGNGPAILNALLSSPHPVAGFWKGASDEVQEARDGWDAD
jgi:y4mF family transcriptional regulator